MDFCLILPIIKLETEVYLNKKITLIISKEIIKKEEN